MATEINFSGPKFTPRIYLHPAENEFTVNFAGTAFPSTSNERRFAGNHSHNTTARDRISDRNLKIFGVVDEFAEIVTRL